MAKGPVNTVAVSTAATATIAPALTNQRVVVTGYNFTGSAATTVTFANIGGGVTLGSLDVPAVTLGAQYSGTSDAPAMQSAIGDGFQVTTSAGTLKGHIAFYYSTG